MSEQLICTIEYGNGSTLSCNYNNTKPHISLKIPVVLSSTEPGKQIKEAEEHLSKIREVVDSALHETLDREAEWLLGRAPVYSEGPFLTLLKLPDPDQFFIVDDHHNIPEKWKQFVVYDMSGIREAFFTHLAVTKYPDCERLHSLHSVSEETISAVCLPELHEFYHITIDGAIVAIPGWNMPMKDEGEHALPDVICMARPKKHSDVAIHAKAFFAEMATDIGAELYLAYRTEDYEEIMERFKDVEVPEHTPITYYPDPNVSTDNDDESIPF